MIRLRFDVMGVDMILAFVCKRIDKDQLENWQYGVELEKDGNEYDVNLIHDQQGSGCAFPLGLLARAVIQEIKSTPQWIYFNLESPNDN